MGKRDARRGEPGLFDLPLVPPEEAGRLEPEPPEPRPDEARSAAGAAAAASDDPGPDPGELPLFPGEPAEEPESPRGPRPEAGRRLELDEPARPERAAHPSRPVPVPEPMPMPAEPPAFPVRGPGPAPFAARALAAAADLGVHALVAGIVWIGVWAAGARLGSSDLPALGVFLLAFSFLYSVVSLAFWGRTPGMALAGVVARGGGDRPLTFGQTGLRWLAAVLTALLFGLPLLLALTGRSLADRLSGSETRRL